MVEKTKRLEVLVVDDDPYMLTVMRRMMRRMPVTLRCASSTQEALQMLNVWPAGLVMSAFQMPQIDGIAFLRLVRHRYGKKVKCVLHTGVPREAMAAGCDLPVYMKPIDEGALRQLVAAALLESTPA